MAAPEQTLLRELDACNAELRAAITLVREQDAATRAAERAYSANVHDALLRERFLRAADARRSAEAQRDVSKLVRDSVQRRIVQLGVYAVADRHACTCVRVAALRCVHSYA
jgi:hypothetical protein